MKKVILFTIAGLLAAGPAAAGDDGGEIFLNYTYRVKPDKIADFEKVMQEWVAISKKHKFPEQMHVYSNARLEYDMLVPIKNFAEVDQMIAGVDKLMKTMGLKKWNALEKREQQTYESMRVSVMHRLPKLSYRPEQPRVQGKEAQAYVADFLYLKPDKEEQAHKILHQLAKLAEKKQVPDGFDVYAGSFGWDTPVLIGIIRGKDAADIRTHNAEMWKMLGKPGEKLYHQLISLLRERDQVDGRHRPELSNPAYR